jgi:16S rRNA (adenine1518-N6/adenine1519-N6)-dimethyltransferase
LPNKLAPEILQRLDAVVTAAFGQRRKTLRNSLSVWLTEADFDQLQIDPVLRAENLSVADYLKIVDYTLSKA